MTVPDFAFELFTDLSVILVLQEQFNSGESIKPTGLGFGGGLDGGLDGGTGGGTGGGLLLLTGGPGLLLLTPADLQIKEHNSLLPPFR